MDQPINFFNRGQSSFQHALQAWENKNFAQAETALISAARDIADCMEWALKIYLQNIPKLSSEDRRKLRHPNFNDLITLMKKYGKPPFSDTMSQQMYGYRDMRNEATHKGAIPPIEEVRGAVEVVSQFLRVYLGVEEHQLKIPVEEEIREFTEGSSPKDKTPTPTNMPNNDLTLSELRSLLQQKFDDAELDAFCLDYFPQVYDRFSRGMQRNEKVTLLLDHCRRDPMLYQALIDCLASSVDDQKIESVSTSSQLTSSKRRRLEREKQNLERQIETLSDKIDALNRQLSLETRGEEKIRLQAVIEDSEKLRAEFETKLDEIESLQSNPVPESTTSAVDQKNPSQSISISGSTVSGQIAQAGRDVNQSNYIHLDSPEVQLKVIEVVELIDRIKTLTQNSSLPHDQTNTAMAHLRSAKEALKEAEPDKGYAAKSLQKATKILKESCETIETGEELWGEIKSILTKLLPWLGITFRF